MGGIKLESIDLSAFTLDCCWTRVFVYPCCGLPHLDPFTPDMDRIKTSHGQCLCQVTRASFRPNTRT